MRRSTRHYLVRNLNDGDYLETFVVSAVASILTIRFYLYVTGFPQVGGKGLHVAHMLWGGLLMLVSIVMLFSYLDRHAHTLAAVIGGAGFGLFIDELGKFLTSNNNYFFQPAASIIYVVFMLMYLIFRLLQHERNVTERSPRLASRTASTLKSVGYAGFGFGVCTSLLAIIDVPALWCAPNRGSVQSAPQVFGTQVKVTLPANPAAFRQLACRCRKPTAMSTGDGQCRGRKHSPFQNSAAHSASRVHGGPSRGRMEAWDRLSAGPL